MRLRITSKEQQIEDSTETNIFIKAHRGNVLMLEKRRKITLVLSANKRKGKRKKEKHKSNDQLQNSNICNSPLIRPFPSHCTVRISFQDSEDDPI